MDVYNRYDHYFEAQKENHFKKKTEQRTDWTKRISSSNMKTEQAKIVEILRKVANFLENVQIMNEDSLVNISKPLDNLLSSLKYLPIEPFFTNLPKEIKTDILSYLCESGAFVGASVCQEWRDILNKKLNTVRKVTIGKSCTNKYSCQNSVCFMPEEMLKASITLKLNIPLEICCPVKNVDSKLLAEGLMSVSDFTITDKCECTEDYVGPRLTEDQMSDLFESLEKESEMESRVRTVQLRGVDMTHMDQDRLINCLLKTKELSLDQSLHWKNGLDFEMLIEKLLQVPIKLSHLVLRYIAYSEDSAVDLANALCRVKSASLGQSFPIRTATITHLLQNILQRPLVLDGMDWQVQHSRIQNLSIKVKIDWRGLITAEDLKNLITKLTKLYVWGRFTPEQMQAVMSLPGARSLPPQQNQQIQAARSLPGVSVIDMKRSYYKILKV